MRLSICSATLLGTLGPPCLHLEAESDKDRDTLERLVDHYPASVLGVGYGSAIHGDRRISHVEIVIIQTEQKK